jgi:hypothetical protein
LEPFRESRLGDERYQYAVRFWSQMWNVFGTVSLGNQSGRVSREESVLTTQSWESVIRSLERVLEKPALGKPELGGSS